MKWDLKNIFKLFLFLIFLLSGICIWFFKDNLEIVSIITNKELLNLKLESYGGKAPLIYILIQVAQVFVAPVPGEITGVAGGYLFGCLNGFLYSTFALTLGSIINFIFARLVGKEIIRSLIPQTYLEKFDRFFKNDGELIIFALFLFPGFPKDYFCLFLGITNLDFKKFMIFSTLGRIPGTFLLSLQGELISHGAYLLTTLLGVFLGLVSVLIFTNRSKIFNYLENNKTKS